MNVVQFLISNLRYKPTKVTVDKKEVELEYKVKDVRHKNTITSYIKKLQFFDLCFNQGIERITLRWDYNSNVACS